MKEYTNVGICIIIHYINKTLHMYYDEYILYTIICDSAS